MKKILIIGILIATGFATHAANRQWVGPHFHGPHDGIYWSSASNWLEHGVNTPGLPGSTAPDLAIVDTRIVWDGVDDGNDLFAGAPLVDTDVGTFAFLWQGWKATNSLINVIDGGSLAVTNYARIGYTVDSEAILNMAGGYMLANTLQIGFNSTNEAAGGSGIVNMSGYSILHCGAAGFGQENPDYGITPDQDGTGEVHLSGNARFLVNGDHTLAGTSNAVNWITNGWIDAYNSTVDAVYTTNGWTEFTSSSREELPYLYYDGFDTADADNANAEFWSRQSGRVMPYYTDLPQNYSITNIASDGKLNDYWNGAFLIPSIDFASHLLGEEFEFSFKIAVDIIGGEWSSIYLCDEDGKDRGDSRLGMYVPGNDQPWDAIVYYGTNGSQTIMAIDCEWFPALSPYDKTQEHTFQFISTPGPGGTNSFELYIDGVEITDGVTDNGTWIMPDSFEYYFDNTNRFIGIVGVMPTTDGTQKALYDDIYLKVVEGTTYEDWVADWGLTGSDTNRTADIEPDGMDNLLEYALGGNPLVDDAASIMPGLQFPDSTTLEYIYRRRNDAAARGLTYDLQAKGDLVADPWTTTGGAYETGTSVIDVEFDAVTNSADITGTPELFLNLEVTEN